MPQMAAQQGNDDDDDEENGCSATNHAVATTTPPAPSGPAAAAEEHKPLYQVIELGINTTTTMTTTSPLSLAPNRADEGSTSHAPPNDPQLSRAAATTFRLDGDGPRRRYEQAVPSSSSSSIREQPSSRLPGAGARLLPYL